ncbi:uncharacterized protein LOC132753885 [Ruditapes philippinarum]|uniref:uncharacterized protein LOC132753885 n=1 Tax=Ruditapes philippinarum TaxID=129788 RepID=UPI00295BDA08|nr:uncharacterized protein LOC132753885 [Ruditapes philippinarum]
MCVYKVLLQSMLVFYTWKYTDANLSADDVYSMLAVKIDAITTEMSLLRRVLMSTKSELAFTQSKLKSTETEVNMIKRQCGLISGITTNTRSPITPTENSTSTSFEDETCCQVVEKAIIRMKAEQKQTKQDIENVIEKKMAKVNER